MISDDALAALKDRNPVDQVAAQWVTLRRKGPERRGQFVGPCPICSRNSNSKSAGRFECDADKWVCAVCGDGGDVIRLVMKREGVDFRTALDRLGGVRDEAPTPALARKRGMKDYDAGVALDDPLNVPPAYDGRPELVAAWRDGWRTAKRRADYEMFARERERKRLLRFWNEAAGDAHRRYLAGRGLLVPRSAQLRTHAAMPYFADGRENEPLLIHTGPAMLAPFFDIAGAFIGLHITWLDPVFADGAAAPDAIVAALRKNKGKALIVHPDTGEVLIAKKMRGTKRGGYIDLGGWPCNDGSYRRMISGEGIETVLSPFTAMARARRLKPGDLFRCAGDLGNLAGKASATVAHPTLKADAGRPQRVPGPEPDLSSPAMPVPETIEDLILLGDGDSDPVLTRHALARAGVRHARDNRIVRVCFAADGHDFNDMLPRPARD
ncbi:MAG: hypothetical protein KDE14_01670 [Rhodobacteraceae bacterium]|nr:hypothetical protein [Paracoccaceae bacterium]